MALEQRAAAHPWSEAVFAEELAREVARVVVLRDENHVVAFLVVWIVGDELSILNVATDPAMRRRGLAARLIEYAVAVARRARCKRLLLEVRRSNDGAIRLYKKYGFRPIGVRAGYYASPVPGEDALVMRLSIEQQ